MIGLVLLTVSLAIGEACLVSSMPICTENEFTYHEHEADSTSYYLCANGILTIFSCPPGLYYNKESSICEVNCERCNNMHEVYICSMNERSQNKPHTQKCSKYIHCDARGLPSVRDCGNGLHFSPTLGYCTYPEISNCQYDWIEELETCPATKKCNIQDVGLQFPYPPDCNKYIYCKEGGITQIRVCVFPNQFSPTELYCMDPEAAGCKECSNSVQTTPIHETQTTEIPICLTLQECPINSVGITLPYPEDCTKYIYCDYNSLSKIRTCTNNRHYSPTLQYCEIPEIAKCTFCIPATTTTPVTEQICPPIPTCSPLEHGNTKPYPPDCTKYIYCNSNGDEIVRLCPDGYHYSAESRYCLSPEIAKCIDCIIINGTEMTTLEPVTIDCHELPSCAEYYPGVSLPYGLDCRKYIYCTDNGQPDIRLCPFDYEFSSQLFTCTSTDIAQCKECEDMTTATTVPICADTPKCNILDAGQLKPYPPDCTKYIYCNENGESEISLCPKETEFSPVKYKCIPKELSDCIYCFESSTTTNEYYTTSINSSYSTSPSTEETLPICPPIPVCSADEIGQLKPFPPDCTKYIYCSETGNGTISWCAEGENFDINLNRCSMDAECVECTNTVTENPTTYCPQNPTCQDADVGKVKPVPSDCTKYIYCDEFNIAKVSSCPYMEHFSPSALICTLPNLAMCPDCEEILPTTEICPETPSCTVNDTGLFKPFPPDCTKYIYCDNNLNSIVSSCPFGTQFDVIISKCSDTALCHTCVPLDPICPPTPGCNILETGNVKPYPPDCSKYIYCNSRGEEVISVCPKDELFSTTENKCVNAEYANCMTCREPSTESSTVTNVSPEITTDGIITTTGSTISVSSNTEPDFSTTGDFSITDSDTTLSSTLTTDDKTDTTLIIYETSTISTTPGIPLPPCPPQPECKANDQNNRLPYPPECQMYVKCKKSSPDEYWMCPDGKEFSPITQWCEFPNIANCTRCGYDGTLPPVEGTETPPIENSTLPYFKNFVPYIKHLKSFVFKGVETPMQLDKNEMNNFD